MSPLHIWKSELIGSTRAEAAQSSYRMKRDNQVFSFVTSEEKGDVSELCTRKQWKPTASWPSWVVMNKRTSFGSKYAITTPNRSSQNGQRTIGDPLVVKVRRGRAERRPSKKAYNVASVNPDDQMLPIKSPTADITCILIFKTETQTATHW